MHIYTVYLPNRALALILLSDLATPLQKEVEDDGGWFLPFITEVGFIKQYFHYLKKNRTHTNTLDCLLTLSKVSTEVLCIWDFCSVALLGTTD